MNKELNIISMEAVFLSKSNIRDMSVYIGRDASEEMKKWTKTKKLDDYESVQMDYSEVLDYINIEFVKAHKKKSDGVSMQDGGKYPKYKITDNVEGYTVDDFRTHDAQYAQEVIRSNENFRYGNRFRKWETSLYKRHYDREEHEAGLRDTRELNTLERGYDMEKIYGENEYTSSDSIMYNY